MQFHAQMFPRLVDAPAGLDVAQACLGLASGKRNGSIHDHVLKISVSLRVEQKFGKHWGLWTSLGELSIALCKRNLQWRRRPYRLGLLENASQLLSISRQNRSLEALRRRPKEHKAPLARANCPQGGFAQFRQSILGLFGSFFVNFGD